MNTKALKARIFLSNCFLNQTILYANAPDEVVPIVISTAKNKWRLPRRFRAADNDICGEVTLNFSYLLFDFAAQTSAALRAAFPNSHPYLLGLHSLQQLSRESIETFFVSSLDLLAEERLRLMGQVTNCPTEASGNFSLGLLESIEAGCIKKMKDRLMRTVKIGQEGWLEQGFKKGLAEVALRMLEEGMSVEVICRTTGLKRSDLTRLKQKRA